MRTINRYNEPTITYGQMNLLFYIRNLWREMATWTRTYLASRYSGIGAEDAFDRLYKIPQKLGDVIQLIFGSQAEEQYIQLLSVQLVLVREIIEAHMTGNADLVDEKVQQLYQNAEDRIKLVASINPFWDETIIRNLIYTYHQYTIEEITTYLAGDYQRNIDIYDRLLQHADSIGDYFAQGLFNFLSYTPQQSNQQ